MFPDLQYTPAARILTRVISRPTEDTLTVDLGYKACASTRLKKRLYFLLTRCRAILQNEEHLVLRTQHAGDYIPSDELLVLSNIFVQPRTSQVRLCH